MTKKIEPFGIPNPYIHGIKKGHYYNKEITRTIKREFEAQPPRKIVFIKGSEGSGKSSTLDRIKKDPEILGDRYLPIYIPSGKILPRTGGDFLRNLYARMKRIIGELGIQLFEETAQPLNVEVNLEDVRALLDALEKKIRSNDSIILLIFDDFDKFFEGEILRDHLDIIHFFKKFADESNSARIILSGRSDLDDLFKCPGMNACPRDILTLEMKIFDRREFDRVITEPVKDWLTYSAEALEEIRKMTGGNLYCQQLLCHYIIEHLNRHMKNTCDAADVRAAAEDTINDKRDDFKHFWDGLDAKDKLVCSAVMDEQVVKKRGLHYFIEQPSLLHYVFQPETLAAILDKLYRDDFITKIEGRRFDGFPFKIPLYGNWIRKEHPFINTIVEHFDFIAHDLSFPALGMIAEAVPVELFSPDRRIIVEFIREWFNVKTMLKESGRVSREQIEVPLKIICRILDLNIIENHDLEHFTIDFKKLNIGSIEEAFFLIQDRLEPEKSDIQHLRDIIMSHASSTNPCLFFCLKRNDKIDELVEKTFLNIILVENDDLKNILFSSRPLQTLKDILFQQLSSSQISPYQTDGPAITTFYGRQRELRMILGSANRSFTVIGARKIGKSSLLARIKNEMDEMGAFSIFMDLESPANPDYRSFLQRMELEIQRLFGPDIHFGDDIDQFNRVVKQLPTGGKKLHIILDEIDELLLFDKRNDYRLIRSFRSLFHEGSCRFILSGFEVLKNIKRDIESPFYNFCEEVQLGPLEEKYAMDLISEPMNNIGIRYENPADRKLILKYTSLHPNLIQFFCKHLIEKLDENLDASRKRLICRSDIKELYNYQYDNYVIDDFYMFYSDLGNLEKLMVILLVDAYPEETAYSIKLINRKLMDHGVDLYENQIHQTIQKLTLRFILLDKSKGLFEFALPHFPGMLKDRIEERLTESLVKRVREGQYGKSV